MRIVDAEKGLVEMTIAEIRKGCTLRLPMGDLIVKGKVVTVVEQSVKKAKKEKQRGR